MAATKRISDYKLFNLFADSLAKLQENDVMLLSWQKPKAAFCFRMALYLQQSLPEMRVDLQPCAQASSPPCDIMICDLPAAVTDKASPNIKVSPNIMEISCKPDYFSMKEQEHLISRASDSQAMVLAVAFFPKKRYFLIYRALQDKMEYYHFDRNLLVCKPLKSKDLPDQQEDKTQLSLNLPKANPRKRGDKD